MRIVGTLKQYGNEVQGTSNDGKTWKRREVIVDASYRTDRGDDIEQSFVGSTFKEFTDEQLEQWASKGQQLAFYIYFRAREYDGRNYQDVTISNIREIA